MKSNKISRIGWFSKSFVSLLLLLFVTSLCAEPVLNFSDLISGPDTGLGDSEGSGVIVTIWGQNLGNEQSISTIKFKDSADNILTPKVYYWKRADGNLPGGPADLYSSHYMQEISFSIPDSTVGPGEIYAIVDGKKTNSLPLTVRKGNIYHVKPTGNDASGNGSFSSPWFTVKKALSNAGMGSTIYVHGGLTGGPDTDRAIYWNNASASSTLESQFSIVSYPGTQATAQGNIGFSTYKTSGMVISKYKVFASSCQDSGGQPVNCSPAVGGDIGIQTDAFGRSIGNTITDQSGGCASKTQAAITGNSLYEDNVSNYKIYGNEIYDYGCNGSSKLHHTTYMSIRSQGDNEKISPWEFGWNYLHGNKTKNGIHMYDENEGCGDLTDTILIHDNVVVDQGGAGIFVGSTCGWSMDTKIYNNVLINVGLATSWNSVDVSTSDSPDTSGISFTDSGGGLLGTMYVFNNIIYKWNNDDLDANTRACFGFSYGDGDNISVVVNDNICQTDKDVRFIGAGYLASNKLDNITGNNNVWYNSSDNQTLAITPLWDKAAITNNPGLIINNSLITVPKDVPVVSKGTTSNLNTDVYGTLRSVNPEIGAVEYLAPPPSPPIIN